MGEDRALQQALFQIPEKILQLVRKERCDLMLLSGDLFDGQPTGETVQEVKRVLKEVQIPVFISPGNHDYVTGDSVWLRENWPENVHIFTKPQIQSVALPDLDCRIYGAGFDAMDCQPLLKGFRAQGEETWQIGVLHGDPVQKNSPYNPMTQAQIGASGLSYLALGHVHKNGEVQAKDTLCAWPGCPMGRGFDELGEKGLYIVTLDTQVQIRFVALDTPRFHELTVEVETDAQAALEGALPAFGSQDRYRIYLTGEAETVEPDKLKAQFPQFPYLDIRDKTQPPRDLWACAGEDSLEGVYFKLLQQAMEGEDPQTREDLLLAAKISRRLLDGRQVSLP